MNSMIYVTPILIFTCMLSAYYSTVINKSNCGYIEYSIITIFNIILWIIVAKLSKNLLIDSFIFDIVMTLGFAVGFIYLGYSDGFTIINWLGIVLCVLGIVFIKL